MAHAVAEASERPAALFASYAEAHFDRVLLPAAVAAIKSWHDSVTWRGLPEAMRELMTLRSYTHGGGRDDELAVREARVRESFTKALAPLSKDMPADVFHVGIDEAVSKIVAAMGNDPPVGTGKQEAAP
jgi:hypothetical protein